MAGDACSLCSLPPCGGELERGLSRTPAFLAYPLPNPPRGRERVVSQPLVRTPSHHGQVPDINP